MHKTSDSCILGEGICQSSLPCRLTVFLKRKKQKQKKKISYCNVFGSLFQRPSNLTMKGKTLSPISHLSIELAVC